MGIMKDKNIKKIKIPKQYYSYIHYLWVYPKERLPVNYVLGWEDFLKGNSLMAKYYTTCGPTKKEAKKLLDELPKYHKFIQDCLKRYS